MANQHTKGEQKEATAQQLVFIEHFLKFGNGAGAARHAGYANPDMSAARLMAKPHIKRMIKEGMQAKAMDLAPDMLEVLASIALDEQNVMARDRIAAATGILDRAGLPNGRSAPTVNIDNSQKTTNVVAGDAVQRLIQEVWMRGASKALPAPNVALPTSIDEDEEEAEFVEIIEPNQEGETGEE